MGIFSYFLHTFFLFHHQEGIKQNRMGSRNQGIPRWERSRESQNCCGDNRSRAELKEEGLPERTYDALTLKRKPHRNRLSDVLSHDEKIVPVL